MARILISIQSGVETGQGRSRHPSRWDVFRSPSWLRPGWAIEEVGFWGLVCRGPVPADLEAMLDASTDLPPMVFRVLREDEPVSVQADTARRTLPRGRA